MIENDDRRVLGAIEFVSAASGARVRSPLNILAPALDLRRNRSGLFTIFAAVGLDGATQAFETQPPPPNPAPPPYTLEVTDPFGLYAPRSASFSLPLDADSTLFSPLSIALLPSRAFLASNDWAVLRVSVMNTAPQPIANAMVRLTPIDVPGAKGSQALSDADGEALLFVTGAPQVLPGSGAEASLTRSFSATLDVVIDPAVAGTALVADPDSILSRLAANTPNVVVFAQANAVVSSGAEATLSLKLNWP